MDACLGTHLHGGFGLTEGRPAGFLSWRGWDWWANMGMFGTSSVS
jgi:hypothetical protein